ncbi:MAG: Rrf2 family transcriptional regulator [Candidatus Marinimicrobia bacterium]|jgi:Rrf2 family iron-sulfur cluster assembly transcriptional regulator|nr:Rrf2 family transcriptional regulator [Candidatus Neomarinimicrobiota bacterium]MBT6914063.1 Rrf2 family transcriptional regulator [Candidatus Neomarinimicrobiota bacterium]MBT7357466.1 Rrf2 family transcriptional regulator [Candidatus Neomarinimicrobiota bacterium]
MSNILSKSSQYAIQAVMYLAGQPKNSPVFQRDIASALDIPNHFLGKVLQILVKHDLILSHKGINGGFVINQNGSKITLDHIIRIIDGDGFLEGCIIGFPFCSDENPCPVHHDWGKAKTEISKIFEQKNINQFSGELQSKLDIISLMNKKQEQEA